jgi:hypothetical protein
MRDPVASAGSTLQSYDSRFLFRAAGNRIYTETCYPDAGIVYVFGSLFINMSC